MYEEKCPSISARRHKSFNKQNYNIHRVMDFGGGEGKISQKTAEKLPVPQLVLKLSYVSFKRRGIDHETKERDIQNLT
jgi:hypothetical protein